jgi:hypothetical protein
MFTEINKEKIIDALDCFAKHNLEQYNIEMNNLSNHISAKARSKFYFFKFGSNILSKEDVKDIFGQILYQVHGWNEKYSDIKWPKSIDLENQFKIWNIIVKYSNNLKYIKKIKYFLKHTDKNILFLDENDVDKIFNKLN